MPKKQLIKTEISIGTLITLVLVLANVVVTFTRREEDIKYLREVVVELKQKQEECLREISFIKSRLPLYEDKLGLGNAVRVSDPR